MDDLLGAVVRTVRERVATPPPVERATAGANQVMVELPESAGVAHRPPGPVPDVAGRDALAVGADAARAETDGGELGVRAVGVAALNALCAPHVAWRVGDPMQRLVGADVVTTVGLFRPALHRFGASEVRVIERRPVEASAPPGVALRTFAPGDAAAALDGADVAFVTGSTLVYGGADAYLDAARTADAPVVLIGATASFLPDPAFEAGVAVLAGARVTDRTGVRAAIANDACGTDAHDAGLQKVYVARDPLPSVFDDR